MGITQLEVHNTKQRTVEEKVNCVASEPKHKNQTANIWELSNVPQS